MAVSECGTSCSLCDHQSERCWQHLDMCQFQTILYAEPPRSNCPEHGPRAVKLPWAEPGSRLTGLFEGLASTGCGRPASKLLPIARFELG